MNEVVIDRRAFDNAITMFARESGVSGHDVLRDEMRLFVDRAIKVLPPKSIGQGKESIKKNIPTALGEIDTSATLKALNRNFGNRFFPLEFNTEGEPAAVKYINKFRNKRGRVSYTARNVHIPNTSQIYGGKMYTTKQIRNKIIRDKQKHVGFLKAGWEAAASMLGVMLPEWISRHDAPGSAVDTFSPRNEFGYVEAVNKVPYSGRYNEAIKKVLQGRVRAIETRIDKEIFRLAKKYSAK